MSSKKYRSKLVQLASQHRVPASVPEAAIQAALQQLDCPRSLAVWIIIRDDPMQLKTLTIDPLHYNSVEDFRDSYFATKLLSKASFLKTGIDKEQAALSKFFENEDKCKVVNSRFRNLALDPNFHGPNVWLLNATRRKIANILVGYSPEELFGEANWGPGVSTKITGAYTGAANKFQNETGITRDLYALIHTAFEAAYPSWGDHLQKMGYPSLEVGNKVVTVPKDAFIDRVIAVEPGLNLWFQKAIGMMIRRRLGVNGIDLDTQEENQQMARKGSFDSSLATVDFSSASDTISEAVVRELLPNHWFQIMDACRSHFGIIEGKARRWNKFSSMGNGFTFELETLIFFAAALSVCEYLSVSSSEVRVFGDDVILPSPAFDLYSSFCEFLGFAVNAKKSFSSSPFRESCGAHYWGGVDVKPVFLKKYPSNVHEVYRWANAFRRVAYRRGWYFPSCDIRMKQPWLTLIRSLPKDLRIFGPDEYGDGFLIGNFDEAKPVRARGGIEGYLLRNFVHQAVRLEFEGIGLLLARLRNGAPTQAFRNTEALRGRTRVSFTKILVHQWRELGPWV